MKAFEVMATLNNNKQLLLDEQIAINTPSRVKVIVLVADDEELNSDDTPVEEIKASLKQALQEAKANQTIPLEQMWDGIDV
ncbi:MAG: hypothetical protein QNJ32_25895 [Xenococcaceae cyanobacterium MO_167.B27]|nr:hypothetical protein [Xenococcaceae cyanobacterium MO_167.B27]